MDSVIVREARQTSEIAEEALVSCLMLEPELIDELGVRESDFFNGSPRHIFQAICGLRAENKAVDLATITTWAQQHNLALGIGDASRILTAECSPAYAVSYFEQVREAATRRQLLRIAQRITERVQTDDSAVILADLAKAVDQIAATHEEPEVRLAADVAADVLDELQSAKDEDSRVVPTGFSALDYVLNGGLQPGELTILAARPAMGKSTLALQIALHAAKAAPANVFSLEMTSRAVVLRYLAVMSEVPHRDIVMRRLSPTQWSKLAGHMAKLGEAKLFIDDRPGRTPRQVRQTIKALRRKFGKPSLIVVDYLGLMGEDRRHENQNLKVGEAARVMKEVAKESDTPVLLLAQLSRDVERRGDKRPTLSDLRDSGEIEQHADVVAFIYRDEYYNPKSDDKGIAEIIIAKQRMGEVGTVPLRWNNGRFEHLDKLTRDEWSRRQGRRGA